MNALIWRLHRSQVYLATAGLAVLAGVLLVTGVNMAHDYRTALATCAPTQSCSDLAGQLFQGDGLIIDLVNLTLVIPLLFGLFWGAPLVAKEFEDGTQNLVWTQGVTRRRWLGTNVAWAVLAAALWGAAMSGLVSWWRIPEDALNGRFASFDIQGLVPVAYSVCAVAVGIAVGSLFRRVLPALAATLGVFVVLRLLVGLYVRPHLMAPLTRLVPLLNDRGGAPPGAWILSSSIVGPGGHAFGQSFSLNDVPAACKLGLPDGPRASITCVASHGFHQLITYQPDGRFWAFQGLESAIFLALAAGAVGFAFWRVLRRDA